MARRLCYYAFAFSALSMIGCGKHTEVDTPANPPTAEEEKAINDQRMQIEQQEREHRKNM
jgi:hypothetical protein